MRPENRHDALTMKYYDIARSAAANIDISIKTMIKRTMVKLKLVQDEMTEQSNSVKSYKDVLTYVADSKKKRLSLIKNSKDILPTDKILDNVLDLLKNIQLMKNSRNSSRKLIIQVICLLIQII